MKRLVLAVLALVMLSLPGWGQNSPHQQAKAAEKAHRQEARNNPDRPHQKKKHHWFHHRHHKSA